MLSKHGVQKVDQGVEHVQVLAYSDLDNTAVLLREMGGWEANLIFLCLRAGLLHQQFSSGGPVCGWLQAGLMSV